MFGGSFQKNTFNSEHLEVISGGCCHLLKNTCFSPVGFKGNLSLLDICLFSQGLKQMEGSRWASCARHMNRVGQMLGINLANTTAGIFTCPSLSFNLPFGPYMQDVFECTGCVRFCLTRNGHGGSRLIIARSPSSGLLPFFGEGSLLK